MKIKNSNLFLILISLTTIVACSSPQKKLSEKIDQMEKTLFSDSSMVPDNAKAKEAIQNYTSYVEQFPADSASPGYLFKAADLASKINETAQAVTLFGKLIKDYPENKNAPYALFLQGFIYENQEGNAVKARPYYEEFLKKYPDHPIAGDVAFSLENLGKTPEELIKQFEDKIEADSIDVSEGVVN